MAKQQYCFSWMLHEDELSSAIQELCQEELYTDCSLIAEGVKFDAHKILLSTCSPLFSELLRDSKTEHPVITLDGVTAIELQALIDFMYKGEVNIAPELLGQFFNTTKLLSIVGLSHYSTEEVEDFMAHDENLDSIIKCEYVDEELRPVESLMATDADIEFSDDVSRTLLSGSDQRIILNDITKLGVGLENTSNETEVVDDSKNFETLFLPEIQLADEARQLRKVGSLEEDESELLSEGVKLEKHNLVFVKVEKDNKGKIIIKKPTPILSTKITQKQKLTYQQNLFQSENKLKRPRTDKIFAIEEIEGQKKMYICSKCGNKYSHRRTLLHHIHWICDQPATYACNLCSYMGKRKFQLKSHLKHAHSIIIN